MSDWMFNPREVDRYIEREEIFDDEGEKRKDRLKRVNELLKLIISEFIISSHGPILDNQLPGYFYFYNDSYEIFYIDMDTGYKIDVCVDGQWEGFSGEEYEQEFIKELRDYILGDEQIEEFLWDWGLGTGKVKEKAIELGIYKS